MPTRVWIGLVCGVLTAASVGASNSTADRDVEMRARQALSKFDRADAPGCATGAYRDGRPIFKHAFGLANLEGGSRIDARSAFGVASVSKQFTAAAVAIAEQEGFLSLQDDVRKYLPELPDYGSKITLLHLIHHTSGLRDDWTLMRVAGHDPGERIDILRMLARQRALNFEPGTRFLYSNAGYVLLAEVVERATRQSLREYARKKIFAPLGMRNSYYRDRPGQDPRLVTAYVAGEGGWREKDMPETAARIGTQGVVTTLDDYAAWATNLFADRSRLAGGVALTRRLRETGTLTDGSRVPYAFGLRPHAYRGVQTWSHAGSGWGFKAEVMIFPELALTVAAFCNNGSYAAPVALAVADAVLPAPVPSLVNSAPASISDADLNRLVGTYREQTLGLPMFVAVEAGALRVSGDAVERRFEPMSGASFRAEGNIEIEFEPTQQSPAVRFYQRGRDLYGSGIFDRIEIAQPTPQQLSTYAGRYFSDELNSTYVVEVRDGALTAHVPGADQELATVYVFRPTIVDEFADTEQAVILRFERSAGGEVRKFVLNAQFGRVQGVTFERR
ncbi:serine hydrolase [Steroidobacter sp.]|uniref:serine hydrolase n=1 Tax=Steroidobacter sp. TaxID=1978227 RepID=UPI001A506C1B|nr:serine hydrolase [Steroidobacter sp.]MBL8269297.1 serine hydrolase [Steroidobacter sp.]